MNLTSPGVQLRPGILRVLIASLVLSALVWWWLPQGVQLSAPVVRVDRSSGHIAPMAEASDGIPAASSAAVIPQQLPTLRLSKATFDPFVGEPVAPVLSKPALQATPPAAPAAPAYAPPAPAPPSTPPVAYRFLGQMVSPTGQRQMYLARGEQSFRVQVGTRLEDGFVVEAIDAASIRLHYPPSGSHALIPLPPYPEQITR